MAVAARVCVLIALAAGLCGCGGDAAADAAAAHEELVCRLGELAPRLLLTGELEAVEGTDITVPRTTSWTVQIQWMIEDGAEVKAGDKLLEFDNSSFADTLEEQRIAVDRSRRTLEQQRAQARAALITAQLEVEKTRIALAKAEIDAAVPPSVLSRREYQDRQLAFEQAKVAHEKALEDLRVAELTGETEVEVQLEELAKLEREVRAAEQAIETLVITAPRAGTVVVADHPWEGRKFQEGDSPWVGLTIMRIPELSRMRVLAKLMDVDDGRLAPGVAVDCSLDTYPDLHVPGRVVEITPIAQEPEIFSMRRAFRVVINLESSDPARMRPGMSVKVVASQGRLEDVLLAPRAALDLNGDLPRARLADGSWREVELGTCSAQDCVVEAGLDEGQRLAPAIRERT